MPFFAESMATIRPGSAFLNNLAQTVGSLKLESPARTFALDALSSLGSIKSSRRCVGTYLLCLCKAIGSQKGHRQIGIRKCMVGFKTHRFLCRCNCIWIPPDQIQII